MIAAVEFYFDGKEGEGIAMNRRLFFIVPDNLMASQLAIDLEHDASINQKNIHAMERDTQTIPGVDSVQSMDEADRDARIEWWAWRINLALFFAALSVFIVMLIGSAGYWLFVPLFIMVVTFVIGLMFTLYLPMVHTNEFISSMCHGEVLMMIDVRILQVNTVSRFIRQRHLEAITGSVCWHF